MKTLYSCYYTTPDEPSVHIMATGMYVDDNTDMEVLYCTALDLFKHLIQTEFGKGELFDYEAVTKETFIKEFHSVFHDDHTTAPVVRFSNDDKNYTVGIMRFPGV